MKADLVIDLARDDAWHDVFYGKPTFERVRDLERFLRTNRKKTIRNVIRGAFPFSSVGRDCFIASMSLGYRGQFYQAKRSADSLLLDKLSKFKYGYYHGDEKILDLLDPVFERTQLSEARERGQRVPGYRPVEVWFLKRR